MADPGQGHREGRQQYPPQILSPWDRPWSPQVLTPNSLKLNTASERAPSDLFLIPGQAKDLMTDIEKKYNFWYEIWNTDYIPLIAQRQKWFSDEDDLRENDVVYFKLTSSVLSSKWHIGKVEYVIPSRDKKTRKVGISYKHDTEDGSRKMSIVDRPVRQVVKLCDIEDTSLLDDIAAVRNAAKKIVDDRKVVTQQEVEEIITIKDSGGDNIDNVPSPGSIDDVHSPEEILEIKERKSRKKGKSESTPPSNLSSLNNLNPFSELNLSPSPTLLLNPTTIGYAVIVDTEEKQHKEQGRKKRDVEGLADWGRLLETTDNCDYNDKNPYEILLT